MTQADAMEEEMGRLEGQNAFVTGAGGGLGRAIARAFAQEGAKVAVVDVKEDLARRTAAELDGGRGTALVCDVADRKAVFAAMERFTGRQAASTFSSTTPSSSTTRRWSRRRRASSTA